MDPFTQGLLGAAIVQCGPRQKIGRDASWVAFAAAISPDLDIFVAPVLRWLGRGSSLDGMLFHRGPTHALAMVPVFAMLFALPWWGGRRWWFRRRRPHAPPAGFGWLALCCLLAVATHGLLDLCTSYGTQWFWPFSRARMAWDAVPIVDLIYTPLLVLTLLACYVARKGFRHRPARAKRASLLIGIAGMVLSTAYLVAGRIGHDVARYRGLEAVGDRKILSAEAYPMLGSILLWRVVVQTPEDWFAVRVHLCGDNKNRRLRRAPRLDAAQPPLPEARTVPEYETFRWFAGGQLRPVVRQDGENTVVEFHDMRYGLPTDSPNGMWVLRVEVSPTGQPICAVFAHPRAGRDRGQRIRALWEELWNP